MESSLTIDDMINNPDLLLSAVNETFASDTTQQYYTPQTPSAYIPRPVQQMMQKQQSKTQVIEVLLKELKELRSRVNNLEELSQQLAQQQTLEIPPIQIPIRLDITTNDQDTSQNIGVRKATKKIKMTKRKCLKSRRQSTNSPYQGYNFPRKNTTKIVTQYTPVNATE